MACSPSLAPESVTSFYAPQARVHVISRDLALAIGETSYQARIESLQSEDKIETDARLNRWVQGIATRLIQQAVAAYPFSQGWSWELHIVKDPVPNATCSAGGKMTINTGMLQLVRMDKDKVATVLGHEIAHALLEHGRASIGRAIVTSSALEVVALSFKMGEARMQSVADSLKTVTLPLDRTQERESDLLGLQLTARAGFDPVRGATIWIDMRGDEPVPELEQRLAPYRDSHPTDDERLATLTAAARQLVASPLPAR